MLELRPNCELCDRDLPPQSAAARICTYECTFCADCVDVILHNVCPNCGGGFVPRPLRPRGEHRPGTGLGHHPASTRRHLTSRERSEIDRFCASLRDLAPAER